MAHIPRYVPGSFKGCIQGHGGNEGTRIALRYFSFYYHTLHENVYGVYIENYFGDESVTRNKTLQTHQKLNKAVKVPERINFLNEVL